MGLHKGEDPVGVARGMGAEGPADGFAQEKFFGGDVGEDGRFEEVDIKVFAVENLRDNGAAVEPHVGIVDPCFEHGADMRWVTFQKGTDGVRGQKVYAVPPRLFNDEGLNPGQILRHELAFEFSNEVKGHHLVFAFGKGPKCFTGGLEFRFGGKVSPLKEGFGQRGPKRLFKP